MRQHHHQARAVGAGIDLKILGDADKARVVVALILHGGGEALKPVESAAGARGERGDVRAPRLSHVLCGRGGILAAHDRHARQALQKAAALADGLLVGVDLLNIRQLRAGSCQQAVVDLQADAAHDAEVVAHHEIVHRVDRARRAVFHRDNTVAAQALLNGGKHRVKRRAIKHVRQREQPVARKLRICALHALTGDGGVLRKQRLRVRDGVLDLGRQRARDAEQPVLAAAAELENERIERHGIIAQRLRRAVCDLLQLRALTSGVERRKAVCLLVAADLRRDVHAPVKQREQLAVDVVDLAAIVTKFHGHAPSSDFVVSAAGAAASAARSAQKRG